MTARILVVGAGSTGGYFGARLAQAGRAVTFLARPARVAQLRERGLRLHTPDGDAHLEPDVVTPQEFATRASRGEEAPFAVVLVTVKAAGLPWAIDAVAPAIGPETLIVPLLNGLAHADAFAEAYGPQRVLAGAQRIVTSLDGDGDVVLHQRLHAITVGELTPAQPGISDRVVAVRELLDVPGVTALATADGLGELWRKWYFIVASGVVGCLARGTIGAIVATPGGPELVEAVVAETAAVPVAAGIDVPAQDQAATRAFLTAPGSGFVSSLYRDVVAGRPGESEHIVGDFVRRAHGLGVPTPLCDLALLQMRVATRGA